MDLTLIDQDIIYPQNIYRHVLGMREIYQLDGNENLTRLSKVTALAKKLLSLYPWIQVNTFTGTFEKYIQNNKLDAFDYIINATGNSVNMRILNKEVLKNKKEDSSSICLVRGIWIWSAHFYTR